MKPLEQVLADLHEEVQMFRRAGYEREAEHVERIVTQVQEAAHEYLTWLREEDAMLRSGRTRRWLRGQFPDWERQGHAKRDGRRRWYRMLIVPCRANVSAAYEDGMRAADEERGAAA